MRASLVVLSAALLAVPAFAIDAPLLGPVTCKRADIGADCHAWMRVDADGRGLGSIDLAISPDGSTVYNVGTSVGEGTNFDFVVRAYDSATGETRWRSGYNSPENGRDWPAKAALSPDGNLLYVTGSSRGTWASGNDFATVAFDVATGAIVWAARWHGGDAEEHPCCLAVSPDGSRVYVAGRTASNPYATMISSKHVTVAYDASTGTELWNRTFDENPPNTWYRGNVASALVAVDDDVVVTGWSTRSNVQRYCFYNDDWVTIRYDGATGAREWLRFDGSTGDRSDRPWHVAAANGQIIVGGWLAFGGCNGNPDVRYALRGYDAATGAPVWITELPPSYGYDESALTLSPDASRVYVTTNFRDASSGFAVFGLESTTGIATFTGRAETLTRGWEEPYALAASPDGATVYVAGMSAYDFSLAALDTSDGSGKWTIRKNVGAIAEAFRALVVAPDSSRVFAAGTAWYDYASIEMDAYTFAYDAAAPGDLLPDLGAVLP